MPLVSFMKNHFGKENSSFDGHLQMKNNKLKFPTPPTTDTKEIVAPVDSKDAKIDLIVPLQSTKSHNPPKNLNIPFAVLFEHAKKGLTNSEVAKLVGCSTSNVEYRLRDHREAIGGLKHYKTNRADIWHMHESEILGSIVPKDREKASLMQKVTAAGICGTKITDIEGKTGQHGDITINLQTIITQQQASQREIEDMERKVLSGD